MPAGQGREVAGGVDQLVAEARRRLAGRLAPQPRDAGLAVGCRRAVRPPRHAPTASSASGTASAASKIGQAGRGRLRAGRQSRADSRSRRPSAARSPAKPGAGRGPRIAASSRRARSRNAAGREAAGGQRVLQRGEQRHRRQRAVGEIEDEAQENAGRRPVERHAGRIVDLDVPAAQFGGDPAGQLAVGGDQRRRRAGRLELAAQQQRDRHRLVLRAGAVVAAEPGERRRRAAAAGRARHRSWRPGAAPRRPAGSAASARCRDAAAKRQSATARPRQSRTSLGGQTESADRAQQQQRHQMLRMRRLVFDRSHSARSRPRSRPGRITAPWSSQAITDEQLGHRRHAAGQPGGDDRLGRRVARHSRGLAPQQAVAPLGRVERAFGRENGGPGRGRISRNRSTICQCSARFGRRQIARVVETRPSVATRVEQPGERRGQRGGLAGQQRAASAAPPLQPSTRRVSSSRRRNSGIAGGTARLARPPAPSASRRARRSSRSPIGRSRGSSSGAPASLPSGRRAESLAQARAPRAGSAAARSCAAAAADRRRPVPAARARASRETAGRARSCRRSAAARAADRG